MIRIAFVPLQILLVSTDILVRNWTIGRVRGTLSAHSLNTLQQVSIATFKWMGVIKKLLASEPLRSVPLKDDPSHRVHPDFKEARVSIPSSGARTMYEVAKKAFEEHSDKICMRQREFIGWKSP